VTKVEKKGRTKAELHQVVEWLTGFDDPALERHLASGTTFEDFFAAARLNPHALSITGTICGVRIEEVDDPLTQKVRYLDKLVDELARGRSMERSCGHSTCACPHHPHVRTLLRSRSRPAGGSAGHETSDTSEWTTVVNPMLTRGSVSA